MENSVHPVPGDVCWDVPMVSARPGVEKSVSSVKRNVSGSVHINLVLRSAQLLATEGHVRKNV